VIIFFLNLYATTSGQCINLDKSSVFFSGNTTGVQTDWNTNALGVKKVEKFKSYLGLPTLIGRSKYQTFSFIKERVWKKNTGMEREIAI